MLPTHRIAWGAALVFVVIAVGTLSSLPSGKVAATFSGSIDRERVSAHTFTVPHDSTVEVTLKALGPKPSKKIGLGFGTPTEAGNCALVEALDSTPVNGQIGGTLPQGTYCVAVYDSGEISTEPVDYTVSVAESVNH